MMTFFLYFNLFFSTVFASDSAAKGGSQSSVTAEAGITSSDGPPPTKIRETVVAD